MKQIKSVVILVCICAIVSVALAVTNVITTPIIENNQNAAANEALLQVMPQGKDFQKLDISGFTLPDSVNEAYSEAGGGYVIRLTVSGYNPGMNIMCGVNADGTVSGALCLSSSETLGIEKTFGQNFVGKDAAGVDAVDTISSATMTTAAYRNAVKDSLNAAIILGGGTADLRSEEEILQDNLSAALPAAEGKFSKLFIAEVVEGMDQINAIYQADNDKGYVCLVGEQFVALDGSGVVIGEASAEVKTNVEAVIAVLSASVVSDLDVSGYEGLPSQLVSVQKTESGNYIIEIKAAGYGIMYSDDPYQPGSGEYIYVRVAVTPDGKIIDCLTLSQAETANIGDVCAKESFYGQFDGKTEADYQEIDAISGATVTTDGYKKAIGRVFEIVKILEGGAESEK